MVISFLDFGRREKIFNRMIFKNDFLEFVMRYFALFVLYVIYRKEIKFFIFLIIKLVFFIVYSGKKGKVFIFGF